MAHDLIDQHSIQQRINSMHEGNRHNWVVWSKQVDYPAYLEDRGRFLCEFGWQAPPKPELLEQYLDNVT